MNRREKELVHPDLIYFALAIIFRPREKKNLERGRSLLDELERFALRLCITSMCPGREVGREVFW